MQGSPRIFLGLVTAVVVAVGCASAPSPPATVFADPTQAPTDIVADSSNGIAFDHPVAWQRWQPNEMDWMTGGPLIYLSTDPLRSTCAVAPEQTQHPNGYMDDPCAWPLDKLSPGGVFVMFVNTRILQRIEEHGEKLVMNGAPTWLQIDGPGACKPLDATETIEVLVPMGQPTPLSNLDVIACLRGPHLEALDAQLRGLLRSIRFDAIRTG